MDYMVENACIFIQARMNSKRLPGKVMKTINGEPLIGILIRRLKKSGLKLVLLTSEKSENDALANYVHGLGIDVFRGSEQNVLKRFYDASNKFMPKTIIRVTGDNPLLDGIFVKDNYAFFNSFKNNRKYLAIGLSKTYPIGMGFEIFSSNLLKEAYNNIKYSSEREHVTPYMHQNIPRNIYIIAPSRHPSKATYRLTVDTPEDFEMIERLITDHQANQLNLEEIIAVLDRNPRLLKINSSIRQKKWNE